MNKNKTVFAFDVGSGSLGLAVRKGDDIHYAESLLIDKNIGLMKDERERRRAYRTRKSHKEREKYLRKLWETIGEQPLTTSHYEKDGKHWVWKKGDERMQREFPKKNDNTVYTSCLLRIMLLEGDATLQPWQIYKALHSAIQRRGYDEDIPWKTAKKTPKKSAKKDDEVEAIKAANEFKEKLERISDNREHHFPCYYDAYKMGLWDPQKGISTRHRIDEKAKRARKNTAPRKMVDEEIRRLLKRAGKYLPKLSAYLDDDEKIARVLYGAEQRPAPSDNQRRYPSAKQIDGLLAQKLPRFDNRAIGKCSIIPRLNVCRRKQGIFIRFIFLRRLYNLRYEKITKDGEILSCALSNAEIKKIYREREAKWKNKKSTQSNEERAKFFKLNKTELKKILKSLGGQIKTGHERIEEVESLAGRSRYSRPALTILHELMLSGKEPDEFRQQLLASMSLIDNTKEASQKIPGDYWLRISGHKFRLDKEDLYFLSKEDKEDKKQSLQSRQTSIQEIIASCHSPLIRHRLSIFHQRLEGLIDQYGEPDHVCMEFVREDFINVKHKLKYEANLKRGKKDRQEAKDNLREIYSGAINEKLILKYRLLKEQKNRCPYTNESLCQTKLDDGSYEIDHIFPAGCGGPDAIYNKVLCVTKANKIKEKNLPYQSGSSKWQKYFLKQWEGNLENYKKHINDIISDKRKKALLLATSLDEAETLIDKYTNLAATAWIARLARDIVCRRMGWIPGEKGKTRNLSVLSGGLTNKVARKYKLYSCLNGGHPHEKNRDDKRHHALDAMIISYLPEWARDKDKTFFFKFPQGINKKYFSEKLKNIYPQTIARQKAKLSEQPMSRVAVYKKGENGENEKVAYEMFQGGDKIGNYNPKIYANLNKDKKMKRGHWHTSKSVTREGSRTHGCLFIYPDNGTYEFIPLHAFASPYRYRKFYTAKQCRTFLMHRGKLIHVKNSNGTTATCVGGETTIDQGEYRITEVWTNKYDISSTFNHHAYRVNKNNLHEALELESIKIKEQIKSGGEHDFSEWKYENEKPAINGCYYWDHTVNDYKDNNEVILHNSSSHEKLAIKYKTLYFYFIEKRKGDTFEIPHNKTEGKLPDESKCYLPDGIYSIVGFGGDGMSRISIKNNLSVKYKLATKKLMEVLDLTALE